jgi:predicted ATPase/class 3 adenylate cyclase
VPARPSGTVTFLFTDVEGSTSLLQRVGSEAYAEALAEHRRVIRDACAAHGGVEIDTQGDSLFVAFGRARDAIAAARAAQQGLAGGPIRVRMGIHTGEPLQTENGYAGMDVHRAARVAAAGHGGQVLVSQSTRDLVQSADLLDLGEHRLKDLTTPERIYQLGRESFAPLKSLNRTNLPLAANPLVGRQAEQLELTELLRRARLVTITGAGGTGKTRLALQIAAELADEFVDGVFFVSLAPVSDPQLVLSAATQALGLSDGDPTLARRRALVVLDNFEHLTDAAPEVARLLTGAPELKLLVTSRAPLHVSMEVEYALDPLPQDAAVELFLDRARAVRRRAEPSPAVDEICRRLDGLPLALELAAARLKLLDPPSLLARLDARLPLLTHGPADLPERHRTLEATISWSYDLLDAEAQAVFARLSVFAGTFDVDAADGVVGADLNALATLVDASLLRPVGSDRFLLLETIREFARDRLSDEDAASLPTRHASYYLDVAERAAPELTGPRAGDWLLRLDADQGNLRAALDWYALNDPPVAARLTIGLWRFWFVRGHYDEGQTYIERALTLEPSPTERAELLYELGAIVTSRGDTAIGRDLFERALALFSSEGIVRGEARCLSALGHASTDTQEWEPAQRYYQAAAALFRQLEDELGLAGTLGDLATLLVRSGDPERALPIAGESIDLQRQLGNEQGEALALASAGYACLATGDLERGRLLLADSTAIAHRLGYQHGLVYCLNGLGLLAYLSGERQRAAHAFDAAQRLRAAIGIDHDPDDALVAEAREALAAELGRLPLDGADADGIDVDEAVALSLGVS